jgi:hypothetical protein
LGKLLTKLLSRVGLSNKEINVPDRTHHTALARKLRAQLNGRAFLTIRRREITELLREISGEPTTRIKSRVADDLQLALLDQGVRCYPHLAATEMIDNVQLFHW